MPAAQRPMGRRRPEKTGCGRSQLTGRLAISTLNQWKYASRLPRKLFFARLSKAEGSIMLRKRCRKPFRYGRCASAAGLRYCPRWTRRKVIYKRVTSSTSDETLSRLGKS